MFDCSSSKKNTAFKPDDLCQKYLQNIKNPRNAPLYFLLLLPEYDYRKCLYSLADLIWARKYKFPGKLIIEKFEDVACLPYTIEGPPIPRQLYIMLPKERVFIQSTNFTSRYIDSKMTELKQLFVLLRAKTIKFTRNMSSSKEQKTSLYATVPKLNIEETGAGVSVNSVEFRLNEQSNEMHFDEPDNSIPVLEILKKATFYYLPLEFRWQHIISRRLESNLVYDKYVYKNQEAKLFQSKFLSKLKLLDIHAEYDWKEMQDFEIDYEIEYYPL